MVTETVQEHVALGVTSRRIRKCDAEGYAALCRRA